MWKIENIDLLIWWSPCQDLSIAGKRKWLEWERSWLFWEYVRILKEVKPKYFVLENVASMSKEAKEKITEALFWIEPVMINAALVSAQNRKRLYWVWESQKDWTYQKINIPQPEDKLLLLKDILQDKVDKKYYISAEVMERLGKYGSNARIYDLNSKSPCLNTMQWWYRQPKVNINPSWKWMNWNVYNTNYKSPTLTTNKWDWLKIFERPHWS